MSSASDQSVYRATTTAPVNIAVIKYGNLTVPLHHRDASRFPLLTDFL